MSQNRNKLIELFIGNISNAVIHKIMAESTKNKELSDYYKKEMENSINLSKKCRIKINPKNTSFPEKNKEYIKEKVIKKVNADLILRIEKGYNIKLDLIKPDVEQALEETKI